MNEILMMVVDSTVKALVPPLMVLLFAWGVQALKKMSVNVSADSLKAAQDAVTTGILKAYEDMRTGKVALHTGQAKLNYAIAVARRVAPDDLRKHTDATLAIIVDAMLAKLRPQVEGVPTYTPSGRPVPMPAPFPNALPDLARELEPHSFDDDKTNFR